MAQEKFSWTEQDSALGTETSGSFTPPSCTLRYSREKSVSLNKPSKKSSTANLLSISRPSRGVTRCLLPAIHHLTNRTRPSLFMTSRKWRDWPARWMSAANARRRQKLGKSFSPHERNLHGEDEQASAAPQAYNECSLHSASKRISRTVRSLFRH